MGSRGLSGLLRDAAGVIWPRVCEMCGDTLVEGERHICLRCLLELPRVKLHNEPFSAIHQRLACHAPFERAASMYHYYPGSPSARLLQKAKYNSLPSIDRYLGETFAREIAGDGFFDGIDLLLPVPLHYWKRWRRGYNQSEEIARGIQLATGIAIGDNLICRRGHQSQTRKSAYDRWVNARDIYAVRRPGELDNRHVLIIDDIITTGATIVSCREALHAATPSATVSALSLALTHSR